jgi:hypothetical protein
LASGKTIMVAPTILGEWEAVFSQYGKETVLGRGANIRSTVTMAEDYITDHLKESVGLVARNTRWRREPASDKQLKVLRKK